MAGDFFTYAAATYIVQVLGVVTSLAMRYFLEPSTMGVWSLLDLLLNYGLYSNLGILTVLYTEMPYHLGKKDFEKAGEIRDVGFSFTIFGAGIVGAVFVLWSVFAGARADAQLRIGVAAIAFILIATCFYNFYVSLMWAHKDFRSLSKAIVLNASLYLLLIFLFVPRAKLNGLLAAVFISSSTAAFYLASQAKTDALRLRFDKKALLGLLKAGLPFLVCGLAYTFFMSVDRLVITRTLGLTALGHYSIALLVVSYANVIPKLLSIIVFPSMQEDFGASGSRQGIRRFVTKPATLLAYGAPFLLGTAYLAAPPLVNAILPKYGPGVESMKVFLLGSFFLALTQPIQTYLTTIYKRWHGLPMIFAGFVVAFLICWFSMRQGRGLSAVAFGMSAGFFTYYTLMMLYVFGHFCDWKETLFFYGEFLLCFIYYVAVVVGVDRFPLPVGNPFAAAAIRTVVFWLACAPLAVLAERKTGLLSTLRAAVKARSLIKKETTT